MEFLIVFENFEARQVYGREPTLDEKTDEGSVLFRYRGNTFEVWQGLGWVAVEKAE